MDGVFHVYVMKLAWKMYIQKAHLNCQILYKIGYALKED